ncbi:chromosome segregation ATPase [Paenibacillus phyllosphaerae]|uniref:Chromosome segregation ATPase n=1 Tax=Paenibacillus phyllosphaerae TaxID=274593 RepID=A0A7W5B2L8_9BACL|nr:DUF2642 domain-containing protein [Paenibacillus phyllosphaerae]MBB3113317.1 chromosome segregation ATPase [Paenibacillus phyllosphaerae]
MRRKRRARSLNRVRTSPVSLLQQSVDALGAAIGSLTDRVALIEAAIHRNRIELGEMRSTVGSLTSEVGELTSEEQSIRSQLQQRIGAQVTIDTPVGTVTGVLIAVGEDFVELQESTGAILVVRIAKINSFS